jgi:aspartyl protease family protein
MPPGSPAPTGKAAVRLPARRLRPQPVTPTFDRQATEVQMPGGGAAQLFYLVLLLLAVGGWAMVEYRGRLGLAARTAAAWGLIFLGVAAGYGLWSDIRRDIPRQATLQDGAIEIPRAADGHYHLTLQINGTPVSFLADTGASNMVLSRADARRLGIDPDSLAFVGQARTANGIVRTARVRLPEVTLGPWQDRNVPAFVNDGDMDLSLLGMDYLGLFHVEMARDRMILRR